MKSGHERAGAIILAGGEGTLLLSLTRRIAGLAAPKQFCPILGKETLLEQTRRRVSLSFSPEQTVTVVSRAHERFCSPLISQNILGNLAIQPVGRGTAAAILFGLLRLSHSRRIGTVAIFHSDHYVSHDMIFMRHVDAAISAASRVEWNDLGDPSRVMATLTKIGMQPGCLVRQ
jgi:mannose-1-phosphate guanylyltransferase